jgi:hypothetical protein
MKLRWSGDNLYTELDYAQVDIDSRASYDIVAGPDARLTGAFTTTSFAHSYQSYALRRTSDVHPAISRAIELHPPRFWRLPYPYSQSSAVVDAARRHRLPLVHLRADINQTRELEQDGTVFRLLGWVGLSNGIITTDPESRQEYRLRFRGEYDPQRQDDTINPPLPDQMGIGHVEVFWEPSSLKFDIRATQIEAGVWTPNRPRY